MDPKICILPLKISGLHYEEKKLEPLNWHVIFLVE
jgi:hypothetical protein